MLFIYFQNMALDCSVKDEKDIITSNTASPHMTFVVSKGKTYHIDQSTLGGGGHTFLTVAFRV